MEIDEHQLIEKAASGDDSAVGHLLTMHATRLKRMIAVRMDRRLRPRLGDSDVFQELQVDAMKRLPEFLATREVSFFGWLRFLARQKLAELTRRHLHTQSRDARREEPVLHIGNQVSSIALANFLVGNVTSPSLQVHRREVKRVLNEAIESLDELDREIISLRHVEHLNSVEAATELNISANTCRQRYLRALKRLKLALDQNAMSWVIRDE